MPDVLVYAIAIAAAIAIVPLSGGSFTRLADLHFTRSWLLFAGLGTQIALDIIALPTARYEDVGLAILLLSYVAVLGFCASNIRTRGIVIIGLGILLNAFVIALNAGMPYHVANGVPSETTVKHRPERSSDVLLVLSDRFAIGSPFEVAISIGDLVLGVGIIALAYAGSRRPRSVSRRAPLPRTRYVDLPALEAESAGTIDLREPHPDDTSVPGVEAGADLDVVETTRSSAVRTRES